MCLVCNLNAVLLSGGLSTFYPIEGEAGASAPAVVMHHVHPSSSSLSDGSSSLGTSAPRSDIYVTSKLSLRSKVNRRHAQ